MTDEKKISFLPVPDGNDVPEAVTKLWDRSEEAMGFVPNVFRAQALNADQFLARWKYFNLLVNKDGYLTNAELPTTAPESVGEEDLQPMHEAGLDDHEIMEAVQVIGMFNMTNRISSALGFVPNEEYHSRARE